MLSEKERREKLLQGAEDYFRREGEPNPGVDTFGAFISLMAERRNFKRLNDCFQRITREPKSGDYGFFLLISALNIYYNYLYTLDSASIKHFKDILYDACLPQKRIYMVDFVFANTNWPLCCATIEILGGEILNNEEMIGSGLNKLRNYSRKLAVGIRSGYCGTVSEFNSPTYAGVQIMPMAVLWKHSRIPEASAMGALIQEFIFMDVLSHWHPPTQQSAAPHSRAYMDNTIGGTGILKYVLQVVLPKGVFYDMETAWRVNHQGDNAMAANVAATQFNCPDYLINLATKKSYPYWVQMRTACCPSREGIHFFPQDLWRQLLTYKITIA